MPVIDPNSNKYDIYGNKVKNSELAVSLQYSHIFYDVFGLRFGVFDNTLGLGADIYPLKNNNLAISFEAYDFNVYSNGMDVYTKAFIRWHFYKGMFIQAGVEDIIGNTNRMYMVGAGVRFKPSELSKLANRTEDRKKDAKEESKIYNEYNSNKEIKTKEENNNANNEIEQDIKEIKKEEIKENKSIEQKNDEFFDSLVF